MEHLADHLERAAGIDDILQNEHMSALDIMVDILAERQLAGGFRAALKGCDAHEILLHGNADGIRHFREKRNDALENADQDRALAAIVVCDLCADFLDPRVDLFFGDQYALNVLQHVRLVNHTSNPLSLFLRS